MPQYELYKTYRFEEVVNNISEISSDIEQSDVVFVNDHLVFFHNYMDESKNWKLSDSDKFYWLRFWHPYEGDIAKGENKGEWHSNLLIFPVDVSLLDIWKRINRSSRRAHSDEAVPLLFFLRYGEMQDFMYAGELYLYETLQYFYDPRDRFQTKLDPLESRLKFDIEPRLSEAIWFELKGRRWSICMDYSEMHHFSNTEDVVEFIKTLPTDKQVSAYITRYQRDSLNFYFADGEATVVYCPHLYGVYSSESLYAANPDYDGEPDAVIDTTKFVKMYDYLEMWKVEAVIKPEDALRIIKHYLQEGELAKQWEWKPVSIDNPQQTNDVDQIPF